MDVGDESNVSGNGGEHTEGYTWKSQFGFMEIFNTEREREGEKPVEVIVIMSMILVVLGPWEMHGTVRLLSRLLTTPVLLC